MWRFADRQGRTWDVVAGRASWGAHVALFVPVGHEAPIREAALRAAAWDQAMEEIEALGPAGLEALLDASTIKDA